MPEFTRQLRTLTSQDVRPLVQPGVVDSSTASAIEGIGGQAYKLAAGAAVSGLTGEASSIDEVEADPSLVSSSGEGSEEEKIQQFVREAGNLDSLEKVTAARKAGSISGAAANARAKVLLKKSLSDSGGMFAREIRQAFGGFFNSAIDGGGFFSDPVSPKEKAKAQFEEDVWTFANQHGISYGTALDRITAKNNRDYRIAQIEQTQKLDAGNVTFLTESTAVTLQENFTSRLVSSLTESGEGALDQDQARLLNFKMDREIGKARGQFLARFQKVKVEPTEGQLEFFNTTMKEVRDKIKDIIGDNELQTVLKNQAETMSSRLDVGNHKTLGNIIAMKRAMGESMVTKVFDAMNSKQVKSFYENNELFNLAYKGMFPQGMLSRSAGSAAISFFDPGNESPSRFERESAVPFAAEPRVFREMKGKLSEIISETPAAFVYFSSDKWRAAVERGDYTPQDIERFMKRGIEKRTQDYLYENKQLLESISIGQEVVGMRSIREGVPETTRTVVRDQNGEPVGSKVYTAVLDALKVAKRNPELWENKYESPNDYVISLFSLSGGTSAKDGGEENSPKP